VFHADEGSFAGVRHAQRLFHGSLLVRAPLAVDVPGYGVWILLNVFGDLGGGGARVGIDPGDSRVEGGAGHGLIAEQQEGGRTHGGMISA